MTASTHHTGRLRSMMPAAPLSSNSSPTARPSSRGRSAGPERETSMNSATSQIQHRRSQRHLRAVDGCKSRDRRIAVAVENPQHLALGIGASVRGGIIDAGQNPPRLPIVSGALHRDNPLPHRRQHFPNRKFIGDATGQTDAFKPGARHDQRVGRTDLAAIRQPLHFAGRRACGRGYRRRRDSESPRCPETAAAHRPRAAPRWCRS